MARPTINPETREKALRYIWNRKHKDYRSEKFKDGAVLLLVDGATCSVPLAVLTDAQMLELMTDFRGGIWHEALQFVTI